jgi:hypothetical protein
MHPVEALFLLWAWFALGLMVVTSVSLLIQSEQLRILLFDVGAALLLIVVGFVLGLVAPDPRELTLLVTLFPLGIVVVGFLMKRDQLFVSYLLFFVVGFVLSLGFGDPREARSGGACALLIAMPRSVSQTRGTEQQTGSVQHAALTAGTVAGSTT